MLNLFLLGIAVSQNTLVRLGQTNLAGQEVAIEIPPASASVPLSVPLGRAKILMLPGGKLGSIAQSDGGWGEVATLYPASQKAIAEGKAKAWRTKVLIFTRVSILDRGSDGILRFRRGALDTPEVKNALAQVAAFEASAEALAEGALDLKLDVTINNDPIRLHADHVGDLIDESFVANHVRTRFNEDAFETEDKEYRGPFDSVVFIHAGRTLTPDVRAESRTPISGFSYWIHASNGPRGLCQDLLSAWKKHLAATIRSTGYLVPDPQGNPFESVEATFGSPAMLSLVQRENQTAQDYLERRFRPRTAGAFQWNAVRDDPLRRLPRIGIADIEKIIGSSIINSFDNFGRIASWKTSGDSAKEIVVVDNACADVAVPNILAKSGGQVIGFAVFGGRSWIVLIGRTVVDGTPEVTWIAVSASVPTIAIVPNGVAVASGELPREIVSAGSVAAELSPSAEQPSAIKVTETAGERNGYAQICGAAGQALFDASQSPELSFWVKSKSVENFAVQFGGIEGEIIIGSSRKPAELSREVVPTLSVAVPRDDAWHQVEVSISGFLASKEKGSSLVYSIRIAPPSDAGYWERAELGVSEIQVAGFSVGPATALAPIPVNQRTQLEESLTSLAAIADPVSEEQQKAILSLLSDSNEMARVNVCNLLTKITLPAAIPQLVQLSKSLNAYVSHFACLALANQATPEAWLGLRQTLESGSLDHVRQSAARALALQQDTRTGALLSTLLTARSAIARADGAKAVASLNAREPAIILMAMLNDVDPMVRLAVTLGANPEYEIVCRKLLWSAVNDPSEAVRIESYRKLMASPIAEYQSEGLKGFRDESRAVQLSLLRVLGSQSAEKYLPSLRLCASSSDVRVAAAALSAMAKLTGAVSFEDVKQIAGSRDPRLQMMIIELAKAKSISLPEEIRANLRESIDPEVIEAEKTLP